MQHLNGPLYSYTIQLKVMLFNATGLIVATISDSVAGYLRFFMTVATIGGEKMTPLSVWIGDALEINVQIQFSCKNAKLP